MKLVVSGPFESGGFFRFAGDFSSPLRSKSFLFLCKKENIERPRATFIPVFPPHFQPAESIRVHAGPRMREHLHVRGDSREWSTVVRLLRTHSIVTARLKLSCGRIIQIRKPSLPDAEQQRVYDLLGIDWRQAFPAVKSELPA